MTMTVSECSNDGIEYIFLGRHVPLPLSALKAISERGGLTGVLNLSGEGFRGLLLRLHESKTATISQLELKVQNFTARKKDGTLNEIKRHLVDCADHDIKWISAMGKEFPRQLATLKDPPKFIFMKGEIEPGDRKAVAMIGTRAPTAHGQEMARKIAKKFVDLGFTIVSGLARGIDTISMKAALDAGGRVIGVLGSGLLNIYPRENEALAREVVRHGALISEMFPRDPVTTRALQMRNKITSGMALGNVIVEGTDKSGTKWQLRFGREQGKPAIGVKPRDSTLPQAYMPNLVFKEGGHVIEHPDDVDDIAHVLLDGHGGKGTVVRQSTLF